MKKRSEKNEEVPTVETQCCGPTSATTSAQNDPCCEQPADGSSCCDKSESKAINAEKTGCC